MRSSKSSVRFLWPLSTVGHKFLPSHCVAMCDVFSVRRTFSAESGTSVQFRSVLIKQRNSSSSSDSVTRVFHVRDSHIFSLMCNLLISSLLNRCSGFHCQSEPQPTKKFSCISLCECVLVRFLFLHANGRQMQPWRQTL